MMLQCALETGNSMAGCKAPCVSQLTPPVPLQIPLHARVGCGTHAGSSDPSGGTLCTLFVAFWLCCKRFE